MAWHFQFGVQVGLANPRVMLNKTPTASSEAPHLPPALNGPAMRRIDQRAQQPRELGRAHRRASLQRGHGRARAGQGQDQVPHPAQVLALQRPLLLRAPRLPRQQLRQAQRAWGLG